MSTRVTKYLLPAAILGLIMCWAGCSDSVPMTSTTAQNQTTPITQYFPLDPGYSTTYAVTTNGVASQTSFTIGGRRQIGNASATLWIVESQSGVLDTSYLVATDSALYFLETQYSNPEKILSLPLSVGNSWPRYYNYDVTGYYNGNLGTFTYYGWSNWSIGDTVLVKDSSNNYGSAKNYPSDGANTFTVRAVEEVNVGGLGSFTGAIKISNLGYNSTTNFYWFAPGVGLVKYLIGVGADGSGTPQAEGHLVAYN